MAIERDAYKALEDVVGPENISEDPFIINSYAQPEGPRFEAITLPKDTAEVQAIVRLCNKYRIQYKASSTGWGAYADAGGPGVVKLDLRRMNRILEINEKNMYAVVEPYVIGAQLQAELMKRGLNCNLTGAGSNCSALPIAAHANLGHLSVSGSYGDRNQLALEWVTPDGEIIRMGSLGSSGEWFCGDGPGPSLRGLVRGDVVPLGGLGVFTKAAQKLYHWPGPRTFPIEGISPDYTPSYMPEGFMIRYFTFPSPELLEKAVLRVGESEIGFILMGFNLGMVTANAAKNNDEDVYYFKEWSKLLQGPGFLLIIAGNSPNDFEYKKKTIEKIIDETKGKSLEPVADPKFAAGFIWRFTRVTGSIREIFRANGGRGGGGAAVSCSADVYPLMHRFILQIAPDKAELIKKGLLLAESSDPFTQLVEHGHGGHGELLMRCAPNPETVEALAKLREKANKVAMEGHFGLPASAWGDAEHDKYGPSTSNYHIWLRKIKKTFDPNGASNANCYITVKD